MPVAVVVALIVEDVSVVELWPAIPTKVAGPGNENNDPLLLVVQKESP